MGLREDVDTAYLRGACQAFLKGVGLPKLKDSLLFPVLFDEARKMGLLPNFEIVSRGEQTKVHVTFVDLVHVVGEKYNQPAQVDKLGKDEVDIMYGRDWIVRINVDGICAMRINVRPGCVYKYTDAHNDFEHAEQRPK